MLFNHTRLLFSSKSGTPFTRLTDAPTQLGATTVNAYCSWLVEQGADFEVRLDQLTHCLLVKSNVNRPSRS